MGILNIIMRPFSLPLSIQAEEMEIVGMWKVIHEILNGMAEFLTAVGGMTVLLMKVTELRIIVARWGALGWLAWLKGSKMTFLHKVIEGIG